MPSKVSHTIVLEGIAISRPSSRQCDELARLRIPRPSVTLRASTLDAATRKHTQFACAHRRENRRFCVSDNDGLALDKTAADASID